MLHTLELSTSGRDEMRDITREVASLIQKSGVQEGTVLIYCPHTTAGIAVVRLESRHREPRIG